MNTEKTNILDIILMSCMFLLFAALAVTGLTPVLLWTGSIFYTIWRAPRRGESDAAYKWRVGYEDR
jgi:uncharacterized membrane protein YqjE